MEAALRYFHGVMSTDAVSFCTHATAPFFALLLRLMKYMISSSIGQSTNTAYR